MMANRRFFCKRLESFPKVFISAPIVRHATVGRKDGEKIVIPQRIEREPTDILKALASTVGLDPTSFHYKFPDDPFFYPYTQTDKRVYALSMESGRKSAKWVIKENPGFFKHQLSDPPIKAFLQKIESTNEGELSENSLLGAIEERDICKAIQTYEALKTNKQEVQESTKQSLLELVCFYNSEERPNLDLESKWFAGFLGRAGSEISDKKEWNSGGFARNLFMELDSNCPLVNSAMIQGMLRYNDIGSALELYESAKVKKIKLSVGVYNSLLAETQSIVNDRSKTSDFVMEKLNEMSKANVKPNLGTLNAALKAFSRTNRLTVAKNLIREFQILGIEPSLGSYSYLFQIMGKLKSSNDVEDSIDFIREILNCLENEERDVLHPSDFDFFVVAMDVCSECFGNADLALQLSNLYLKPSYMKFIVRAGDEHAFYKQLFLTVFKTKPIDVAMDMYRRYVLTSFCPEARVVMTILETIHENLVPEYLVELWDDLTKFGYSKHRPILGRILSMMKDFADETSLKIFHSAGINFLEKIEDMKPGDEDTLADVLVAFVKNDDEEMILRLTEFIKSKNLVMNMSESSAETLFEYAVSKENIPLILESLKMASLFELDSTSEMARKALPLLSGGDEVWASGLITEESKKNRKTKTKKDDV